MVLLLSAHRLHRDLGLPFAWLRDLSGVRAELERLRSEPEPAPGDLADLERFAADSERLVESLDEPRAALAARNLKTAFDGLREALARRDAEATWDLATAALRPCRELEGEVQAHVGRLYERLGRQWTLVVLLVSVALLLCALNLVLLFAVHRRRRELERAHSEAVAHASHDPLTGLWNRESILRLLGHELVRAQRTGAPLGVVLADLDDFATINYMLGQDQGDDVLREVGRRLQSLVRGYDTLGRYGGDSFLLVLPNCAEPAIEGVVRRLLQAVGEQEVRYAFGKIQVHLGVSSETVRHPAETTVDALLLELERRLPQTAKRQVTDRSQTP